MGKNAKNKTDCFQQSVVGFFILAYSKLRLCRAYNFFRRFFDVSKWSLLYCDTDSLYTAWAEPWNAQEGDTIWEFMDRYSICKGGDR